MANKRNIFEIRIHPSEDNDLSSVHPAILKLAEFLGERAAEIDYNKQIQLKNESIREEGHHE